MRISTKIMAEHIKANLAKQSSQLMETQMKLASGKRINKPSDDPSGMGKVLHYRSTIETLNQYRENILDAKTRIEFSEAILNQVQEFIDQAHNIASNPNAEDRAGLAREIDNIRQQLSALANAKYGGNYMFAGHQNNVAPFDQTPPYAYNGDAGSHQVMVGEGITVQIEADGSQIFIDGADNLFEVLDDLETALVAVPFDRTAVQATMDPLSRISDRVQLARSNYASDYQRLVKTDEYWEGFSNAIETMRQSTEDADITKAAVDMQVQQANYEVLLATAARVIQPTLVDFLG